MKLLGKASSFVVTAAEAIHLDADLYSSTLYVLFRLAPILQCKDILIFDELASNDGVSHKFCALCDFVAAYRCKYRLLGAARHFTHIAIELI